MTWAVSWHTPRAPASASAAVVAMDVTPCAYLIASCTYSQNRAAVASLSAPVIAAASSRIALSAAVSRVGRSSRGSVSAAAGRSTSEVAPTRSTIALTANSTR